MQSNQSEFDGIWTALVTPFKDDGLIDLEAWDALLARQGDAGIKGVVVCGTTGESPTLTVQEKLSLIRRAKAQEGHRLKIMAGTGGQSTSQSIELSKLAMDAGADSLLVVTPPYNKPNQSGMLAHFKGICEAVNLPVCLYHVPGRTGQKLSPSELADICRLDGVKVVKEASADLELFSSAKRISHADYLSGDDPTFLASLALGGKGCISVISNIFPGAMQALFEAFMKGNHELELKYHESLLPAMQVMLCESNPAPLKAALATMGLCSNVLRLPLASVQESSQKKIDDLVAQAGEQLPL